MSQFAVWYYVVILKEKVMHENNFARLETLMVEKSIEKKLE